MKRIPLLFVLIAVLGIMSYARINDAGFDDGFDSKDSWVPVNGGLIDTVIGGKYIIENPGTNVAIINRSGSWSTFTYSVSMTPLTQYSSAGMAFCIQASSPECYVLALRNDNQTKQHYTLLKLIKLANNSYTFEVVKTGWHSFINSGENTLTVSKVDSSIYIFCNDHFVDSAVDGKFLSGSVGLAVGSGEKISFDRAVLSNTLKAPSKQLCYSDNFNDGDMNGWLSWFTAPNVSVANQKLTIGKSTSEEQSMILSNGDYKSLPTKVVVSRQNSNLEGFYGLLYLKSDLTFDNGVPIRNFDAFVFRINGTRNYAAYYFSTRDSSHYTVYPPDSRIHGTIDTLEVTHDYQFKVNGTVLPDIDFGTRNFDFNAVGFLVDSNVSVTFDDFSVGDSTCLATRISPRIAHRTSVPQSFVIGGPGILYDVRGRQVGQVYDGRLLNKNLGSGQFIVVPGKGKTFNASKAIITVK